MQARGIAAGMAAALGLVACSSSSSTANQQTARTSAAASSAIARSVAETKATALDCADPIGSSSTPPAEFQEVGGAIALTTSTSDGTALQTTPSGWPGPLRLFAKTGLLIRTGIRAQLIVPGRAIGELAVAWGNTTQRTPTQRLIVGPCAGAATWLAFPGGYFVSRPACIGLKVRVSGIDYPISVGVGAPCPGQLPAPQPSST